MKIDKILAMSAYAVQAFATLGLVFVVSRLLPGGEYGRYSLIVASAQSIAVLAFEWVRLAASRFCANLGNEDSRQRKDTIQAAFMGSALILSVLALLSAISTILPAEEVLLGWAIALLIGLTDLLLVFLRVQGSFNEFAILQMVRAFTLLTCSIVGAYFGQSAYHALIGLTSGYALSLVVYIVVAPQWWRWRLKNVQMPLFKQMAVYGLSVAAASNIHLQVPLFIRWVGKAFLPADGFAGLSLAMDILQKPFALVTSAVGGVLTPGVIVEFEQGKDPRAPKLKQIYEAQLWCVLLLLGGAVAFLPDLADLVIKPHLRNWVVQFGPPIAMIFAVHTLIQTTISIPGHLLHWGSRLIANAVVELACFGLLMGAALYIEVIRPYLWLWLGVVAVVLSLFYALPLVLKVPCRQPVEAIYIGGATTISLAALRFAETHSDLTLIFFKALAALVFCVVGLGLYRPFYRKQ